MKSSLENKTVRPGLLTYSFYASDRQAPSRRRPAAEPAPHRRGHAALGLVMLLVIGFAVFAGYRTYHAHHQNPAPAAASTSSPKQASAVAAGPQECDDNTLNQKIIVSISQRHLWACEYHKVVYNTPVITGMEFLPADLTPPGTYKIYAKQTNLTLTGSDSTGTWSDPVSYWMPFLQNQYGTYGFHDATWRPNSAFGNVDPNSKDASHGCVELPIGASAWLYNWAHVGTEAIIKA